MVRTPFPEMTLLCVATVLQGSRGLGTMCFAVDLEVLKRSGSDSEKRHAVRIMPVIEKQHLLLVTLLLVNAAAMEALPIFIDKVCPRLRLATSLAGIQRTSVGTTEPSRH